MILRFLGYALLVLGLVLTPAIFMAEYNAIEFQVLSHIVHLLPPDGDIKTYTGQEWKAIYMRAFDENSKTVRTIYPPTILMLVGAILLDISNRRRRKAKDAI
jgi:hypothetical protein